MPARSGTMQYNAIAEAYTEGIEERSDRTCVQIPTARYYLGNLEGKRVLELGCGSGYFTRLLKQWGADEVVGVDLSDKMIELARRQENEDPLGILYRVADVVDLESLGEFDIIFAAFLLHYSSSVEDLQRMVHAVARNLKPGGRFVAFNENPWHPVHPGMQYDVLVEMEGPVCDAAPVRRMHYRDGQPHFLIEHFHFEPDTYRAAFDSAGLVGFGWHRFLKAPDADLGFPLGYWDSFTGDFSVAVLTAERPAPVPSPVI